MFKLAILWLGIFLLGCFWLTVKGAGETISMVVLPEVPREREPIMVTFKLNNPSSRPLTSQYQFYANGKLLDEGEATIAPGSSETSQYTYRNPLKMGEQVNFVVKTQSEQGNYEKVRSLPPYPPQVCSSFVSFASFSTSVMSSMSSMTYYQSSFATDMGFNIGLLSSLVLIALLILLELTQPLLQGKSVRFLAGLRIRASTVTWILFIIFMGMVYTKVVMILAS